MNFTQEDVDMNHVWYYHTAVLGSKGYDSFHFYVTDGEHSSPPESFYISIKNTDKGDIVLHTKPVTLTEGDRVTLMTDVLMATDGTGKPEKLLYAVSVPPVHGQIEYINYPGVPISSFSQLDVVAQKICYAHDNSQETSKDLFSFTVNNGLKATDGFLDFIIVHPDHIPPTLVKNKGIQLQEGSLGVISQDLLQLADPDSPTDNLTYWVIQHPQHGHLHLKGSILLQSVFTQTDVNNMDVTYRHNGRAGQLDKFLFIATDKINPGFLVEGKLRDDPVVFTIQVEREDRSSPALIIKKIPSTLVNLKDGRTAIHITAHNLKVTDVKSQAEDLVYTVVRSPSFGYLENGKADCSTRGTFTQRDLNRRAIRYIINAAVDVTSDSFQFRVSNPAGNTLPPETFELKWSRISLAETYYRICESTGSLAIRVVRTGQSADPSFVNIKVHEVSAKVGLDFTHGAASLLQFDPGVSTKLWNLHIKNDGLEESNEVLKVVLGSPRNAILGQDSEATVEIIDPRTGACNSTYLKASGTKDISERSGQVEAHWPSSKEHHHISPPRGDVPHADHVFHHPEAIIAPRTTRKQLQSIADNRMIPPSSVKSEHGKHVWNYHGIIPLRDEKQFVPKPSIREADSWPSLASTFHHFPQRDPSVRTEPGQLKSKSKDKKSRNCLSGWHLQDKHCYLLNSVQNATWEAAERACSQMPNGHLTSVHSKREMTWLWRFAGMQPFWIGLMETGEFNEWRWTNGRPVTINSVKQVKTGLTQGTRGKCALVKRKKKWAVKDCNKGGKERYVCSAPALRRNALPWQSQP